VRLSHILLICLSTIALPMVPLHAAEFLNNGVTAHRGDSGNYPENTMAAIDSAIALGADWIEIDIFMTKDGHIVVTHDATTEHFANKTLRVEESTLDALQALDVATGFRKEKGVDLTQCPPATMPTLRQVVQRIQRQHRTRLSIQPKAAIVDEAIALIRELRAEAWVGFNDGDLAKMSRVKELAPEIHVFWDRFKDSPLGADIRTATALGFESIVPHVAALTPEAVASIKAAGIEAGTWTVNDEKTMKHLLNMGVDRIYTDYPGRLLELKKAGDLSN
jgi:glycerophosphoryl diester phosphodiesterase